MIFVTIGTSEPFDRLLAPLAGLEAEELLVQHGDSGIELQNARMVSYLEFDELVAAIRGARAVVAHAGVGTILTALAEGKRPLVVPRRREHGEAVDDHQVVLARRLAESGLVTVVDDPAELPKILAGLNGGALTTAPRPDARLVEELRSFVVDRVDARRR